MFFLNTLAPDGGKASPINFLLKTVKGSISVPSEDANLYQSSALPLPGAGDVEKTFHVCCNSLFTNILQYQSHLIEKADTDMVHEFKLHEMGLLRCTLCSMWVQDNGMSLHLRKFHGIVKVNKNARGVPTSVSQCSSDDNGETTLKSGKSYVIKVSGQTVVAGQSVVGTPTSKSNNNEMSVPIASVSKPTLKFITSGGNIYPNIRFQNSTGGIGGKVIVRQAVQLPSNSVPVVTYGSRIVMKANAKASEAKNGKPLSGNAGVRKILPSGSALVQNNSPFAKTINGLTTVQISGGNIVATTSTGKLSKMKGQLRADEGKPQLINVNKKICRTFKVVEKSSNNKTVSLPKTDLEGKKKTKGADAPTSESPCGKTDVSDARTKGVSNKKKPSGLNLEESNEKFAFLNYNHSEDIFEEFALSLEKIKKEKEKESLAKKSKPSQVTVPSEKSGCNGKPGNSKPGAKKKCRKQVLKPVLEPEGDVNKETPLTSKVKVRKKAKSALASSESVSPKVGKKNSPNTPVLKKYSRKSKENKLDTPKSIPKTPQQTPKGKRGVLKKKRPVGRPRREPAVEESTSNLSGLDTLFDEFCPEDVKNEPVLSPKLEEEENVPTVELDLFTLSSLNEKVSVLLTEPKNPDFKVYASMDAIFVGDSALGDVTNQIGYVTDSNNVVFVNPGHFLFPNVQELDKFVPRPILTVKEKVNMSPRKVCKLTPDNKFAVTCKENQGIIESPKGVGRNHESPGNKKRQPKMSPVEKQTSVANAEVQSYTGPKRALKDKSIGSIVSSNDVTRDSKENVPLAKLDGTSGSSKGVRVRRRSVRYNSESKDEQMPLLLNEEWTSAEIEVKKESRSRKVSGSLKLGTAVKVKHLFPNQGREENIDCNKELKVVISPIKLEFQNLVQDLKKGLKKFPAKHRVALSFDDDCLEKTAQTKDRDSGVKDSETKSGESNTSVLDNIRVRTRSADSVPYGKGCITDSLSSDISDNVHNRLSKRKGRLKSESDVSCRTAHNSEGMRISEQKLETTVVFHSSPDNKDSGNTLERNSDVSISGKRRSLSNSTSESVSEQNPLMPVVTLAENSVIKGKNFDITNVPSVIRNRPMRERRPSSKWLESLATDKSYKRSSPKLRTERSVSDTTDQSSSGKLVNINESAKVLDIRKLEDEGRPIEMISETESEETGMAIDKKDASVVDVLCSSEMSDRSQNEVIMSNVKHGSSDHNEMSAIVTSDETSTNDDWEKLSEIADDGVQDLLGVEETGDVGNLTDDLNSKDPKVNYDNEFISCKINGSQKLNLQQITKVKKPKKDIEDSSRVERGIEDSEISAEKQDIKDAIMESALVSDKQWQPIEIGSKEIASEVCNLFGDDNQVISMKTQQEGSQTQEGTGCVETPLQSESHDENKEDETKFDLSDSLENAKELDNVNAVLVSIASECRSYAKNQLSSLDSFSESMEENCTEEDLTSSKESVLGESKDTVEDEEEVVIQRNYKVDPCRSSRLNKVIKIDEEISITVKQEEQANIFYSLRKGDLSDEVIESPGELSSSVRKIIPLSRDMEKASPAEGILKKSENLLQKEKSKLSEKFEGCLFDCEENTKHWVQSTPKIHERLVDGNDSQEVKSTLNELEEREIEMNEGSESGLDDTRKEFDQAANVFVDETENLQVGISEVTEGDVEPSLDGGLIEKNIPKIVEREEVPLVGHEKNELMELKFGNNSKENDDKISEFLKNFDFGVKHTEEFCKEEVGELDLVLEGTECKVSNYDGGDNGQLKILDSTVDPSDGSEKNVISNIVDNMEKTVEKGILTDVNVDSSGETEKDDPANVDSKGESQDDDPVNVNSSQTEKDYPADVDSSGETDDDDTTNVDSSWEIDDDDNVDSSGEIDDDDNVDSSGETDDDDPVNVYSSGEKEIDDPANVDSSGETDDDDPVNVDSSGEKELDDPANVDSSGEKEIEDPVNVDSSGETEKDDPVNMDSLGETDKDDPGNVDSSGETEKEDPANVDSSGETDEREVTIGVLQMREVSKNVADINELTCKDGNTGDKMPEETAEVSNDAEISIKEVPITNCVTSVTQKTSEDFNISCESRMMGNSSLPSVKEKYSSLKREREGCLPRSTETFPPLKTTLVLSPSREWHVRDAKLKAQVLIQDQQSGVTNSEMERSSPKSASHLSPLKIPQEFSPPRNSRGVKLKTPVLIQNKQTYNADSEMERKSPKSTGLLSPSKVSPELSPPREWLGRGAKLIAQVLIQDQQTGVTDSHVVCSSLGLTDIKKGVEADGSPDTFGDHAKSEKEKTCSSARVVSPNISGVSSNSTGTRVSIKSPKPVKSVHDDREWQPRGAKLKAQIMISDQQNGEMNTLVELTENRFSPVLKSPPAKKARLGSPPANMKDIRSFFAVQNHTELKLKKGASGWEVSPKSSTSSKANYLIADSPSTPSSKDAFRKSRSPCADSASELSMPGVDSNPKRILKANPLTVPSGISSKVNGKINHHIAASSSMPVTPSISMPCEPNCKLSPDKAESSSMLLSPSTSDVKPNLQSIDSSEVISSPPCISSNKNSPPSFKRRKLKLYSVTSSDIRTFFAPVKSNKRKLESPPPDQRTDIKRIEKERSLMKIPKTVTVPEVHPLQTTCHSSKITSEKSQMSYLEASPNFEGFAYGSRQSGLRARTLVRLIKLIKSKQWFGVNSFPFPLDQLCDWNDGMLEDRIFDKYS
ncbi:microtubule-associated protein futsch-like isoform X2 [Palaemon carinicauda]|uniref:microtubule-associated protein futsch-like isoform X2 n=1 Tax=Palaemon carinicauda TaxID=392227 RepID=UPI0035B608F5